MKDNYSSMNMRNCLEKSAAYLSLTKQTISEMLHPDNFRGRDVWCIFLPTIYDQTEPDEFHAFVNDFFFATREKKMGSYLSIDGLSCILFRPYLLSEEDFTTIKEAIELFELFGYNKLCFGHGKECLP